MGEFRAVLAERRYLDAIVMAIEGAVALLLVALTTWGTIALGVLLVRTMGGGFVLDTRVLIGVLDATLVIFVVIELYRIAVAYMRREEVLPTVMEAALVAVARKLVTFDTHEDATTTLMKASALAVLFLSVGGVWYLLRRAGVCYPAKPSDT